MHESSEVFNTKEGGGGVHFTCKTHTVKTVGSKHILLSPYMQ